MVYVQAKKINKDEKLVNSAFLQVSLLLFLFLTLVFLAPVLSLLFFGSEKRWFVGFFMVSLFRYFVYIYTVVARFKIHFL